jgi:ribosomal protein S18 acetylase RimI-like enzyme
MHENVIYLDRNHLESVVEIFKDAFFTDPLFENIFAPSANEYAECLKALFQFSAEVRYLLDWPIFGCQNDAGKIVGAAGVSLPGEASWPQSLTDIYDQFKDLIGPEATARFETMMAISDPLRPPQPYFELGVLGVLPEEQGKGYGGQLVRALNQLSENHPDASGVYVETQNPQNVSFYESLGYQVRGKNAYSEEDNLFMWGMFRPNP